MTVLIPESTTGTFFVVFLGIFMTICLKPHPFLNGIISIHCRGNKFHAQNNFLFDNRKHIQEMSSYINISDTLKKLQISHVKNFFYGSCALMFHHPGMYQAPFSTCRIWHNHNFSAFGDDDCGATVHHWLE